MGWLEAVSDYWRGFADFKGQTSRAGFWKAIAFASGVGFFLFVLIGFIGTPAVPLFFIWLLVTVVPSAAILSRRLRAAKNEDAGKSSAGAVKPADNSQPRAVDSEEAAASEKRTRPKRPTRYERQARKQQQKERKAEAERAHREKYGKPIASGAFGWTLIEVFKTGHVRISGGATHELYGIEFTDLSRQKNQIGRVVGFLGTGGLNMATSTRKGEAYLSISTASGVRTVKTSEARPSDIETANKLVAASKSVVARKTQATEPSTSSGSLSNELEKLSTLREEGTLTDEEFAAAKKKLLG